MAHTGRPRSKDAKPANVSSLTLDHIPICSLAVWIGLFFNLERIEGKMERIIVAEDVHLESSDLSPWINLHAVDDVKDVESEV